MIIVLWVVSLEQMNFFLNSRLTLGLLLVDRAHLGTISLDRQLTDSIDSLCFFHWMAHLYVRQYYLLG